MHCIGLGIRQCFLLKRNRISVHLNVVLEVFRKFWIQANWQSEHARSVPVCSHFLPSCDALTSVLFPPNCPSKIVRAFLNYSRFLRVQPIQYTFGLSTYCYLIKSQKWGVDHYAVFSPFLTVPPIYAKIFFSPSCSSTPLVRVPASGWWPSLKPIKITK